MTLPIPRRAATRALALAVLAALASAIPAAARAQCMAVGQPVDLLPSTWDTTFRGSVTTLQVFGGGTRLVVGGADHYGVFDVTSPMSPVPLTTAPASGCFRVAGSADGKFVMASTDDPSTGIVVGKSTNASNTAYASAGRFPPENAEVAVQTVGTRAIAYALPLAPGPLSAADLTNASQPTALLPYEVTHFATFYNLLVRGNWVIYGGFTFSNPNEVKIVLLDASQPGPAPIAPSSPTITTGYPVSSFPLTTFSSVSSEYLNYFEAIADPIDISATPRVYLLGLFEDRTANRLLYRLVKFQNGVATQVSSPFMPPGEFGSASPTGGASLSIKAPAAVAVPGDVILLMWSNFDSNGRIRLYSQSVSKWATGALPEYDEFDGADVEGVFAMGAALGTASNVYVYWASENTVRAVHLNCDSLPHNRPDGGVAGGDDASVSDGDAGVITDDAGQPVDPPDAAACEQGTACASTTNPCLLGTIACTTGSPVCGSFVNKNDGAPCGQGKVCSAGSCVACQQGARCLSLDGCKAGTLDCATSTPTCTGLTGLANGTACGSGGTCQAGVCSACAQSGPCETDEGCQFGKIVCSASGATCSQLSKKKDGAPCPTGVCKAGVCTSCVAGASCTAGDGCLSGTISCSSGAPVCSGLGALSDGTACPGGRCSSGVCVFAGGNDSGPAAPGDGALAGGDATAAAGDAGTTTRADAALGEEPPGGCGCQSATGAWGALAALALAFAVRRRRA